MALHFELVSPAKLLFSGDVDSVQLPGTEGEMTILPQHAPLLTSLRPGVVTVTAASGSQRIFVRGGFAEVNPQGLTVLAERAIPTAELDAAALAKQIKDAEEDVADATEAEAKRVAQENLDHLKALQSVL
ncbi:F0F1 ATP synthase subunit epsilon [Aestuariivirga litoralis]|uniref:F0F1 ATP synthase subunit epsilon n=1 Tax=Aestuariivirga litoralis TaxID=2650924 RepID=UPI0018C7EC65|nr:F0F1 ATP synthase subunit epsilon [Aestuariivirga litoralis]MBG1233646.1 F0F1 ATP synthase subunit epsilon [Aestuariivirga litoralis]